MMKVNLFLGIACLLLLTGCDPRNRQTSVQQALETKVLHVSLGAEPKGIDPQVMTGIPEAKVAEALFEGLVSRHLSSDAAIEPGVAEHWEVSEGGRLYTFTLREHARWSNGDPVTAQDFLYSYQRMLNPALGVQYAYMLYLVEGAEEFNKGETDDFGTVGFAAPDSRTLTIRLAEPTPYFLQMLKHSAWFPVHPPTIERFVAFSDPTTAWDRPGNLVGNGPFVLESWQRNQVLQVRRSETYWDAEQVRLTGIDFYPFENTNTEFMAFENGQIHITDTVPLPQRSRLRASGRADYREEVQLATAYLLFNTTQPALQDARLRQALSLAVDRETLQDIAQAGIPAQSFTPPQVPGYQPPLLLNYDPLRARELLAEAGYPEGRGLPVLEMKITSRESTRIMAEALQQMWREALGIEVQILNMEWKVYLSTLRELDYGIGLLAWFGDYIDPFTFLNVFSSDSGNNRTGWASAAYDNLLQRSQAEPDAEARMRILAEAETVLLEELPIAPVFHYTAPNMVHPSVLNWYPKLLDMRPWKQIAIADEIDL